MSAFQIWYMKPEWFREGILGRKPDPANLAATHVHLMDFTADEGEPLGSIFTAMQGEVWSPNGEARDLIQSKGLQHTSMSVGDVIVHGDVVNLVASRGFETLSKAPPKFDAPIYERGVITAPREVHDLISAHCPRAYRIPSYENGKMPATMKQFDALARAKGFALESIFDARHGKRYMCFAYRTPDERKALWDFHTNGSATPTVHCRVLSGVDDHVNPPSSFCGAGGTLAEIGAYDSVTCPDCLRLLATLNGPHG